jgi:hypothetical protein
VQLEDGAVIEAATSQPLAQDLARSPR